VAMHSHQPQQHDPNADWAAMAADITREGERHHRERKVLSSTLGRGKLGVLLTVLVCPLTVPSEVHAVHAVVTHGGRAGSMSCSGSLVLVLRPGSVPPAGAAWNKAPAGAIPPGPLIERFPLYPGAVPSSDAMPGHVLSGLPPDYRKVARAGFRVPAGYRAVSAWFGQALAACGLYLEGAMPLQQHGGPHYAGLEFVSRDGLSG
jgi:hypothetical protein